MDLRTMQFVLILIFLAVVSTECDKIGPKNYKIVNPYMCKPGTGLKVDCNSCRCGPEPGKVGPCTRMFCNLAQDECIPGSYFLIDGKLCECPKSKNKWDSTCFEKKDGDKNC